eukprot:SAG22_NODE_583_length_8878_cov_47.533546_4_plen_116_part_00
MVPVNHDVNFVDQSQKRKMCITIFKIYLKNINSRRLVKTLYSCMQGIDRQAVTVKALGRPVAGHNVKTAAGRQAAICVPQSVGTCMGDISRICNIVRLAGLIHRLAGLINVLYLG